MKKYTKIICMVAAVCLLGTAAFCIKKTTGNAGGSKKL